MVKIDIFEQGCCRAMEDGMSVIYHNYLAEKKESEHHAQYTSDVNLTQIGKSAL